MKRKPFIIFFTGLTNSGKTTLSQLLFQYLKDIGLKQIKNIDGDKFRKKLIILFIVVKEENLLVIRRLNMQNC